MLRTANSTVDVTPLKELESTEPVISCEYITLANLLTKIINGGNNVLSRIQYYRQR